MKNDSTEEALREMNESIDNFTRNGELEFEYAMRKKIRNVIEVKSNDLVTQKVEDLFNEKAERLKKQWQEEYEKSLVTKKGEEIFRSSPFISYSVYVGEQHLSADDFISKKVLQNPLYADSKLTWMPFNGQWQLLKNNGKRNFVSDVEVVACIVVNATGPGMCEWIIVYVRNVDKPLIFDNGNISSWTILNGLQFHLKGVNVSKDIFCEAFRRPMTMCQNIMFLTIQTHPGWTIMNDDSLLFLSAESVIPGLEEIYPDTVKNRRFIDANQLSKEEIDEYVDLCPKPWKFKLLLSVRVMSLIAVFLEENNLTCDRVFVVHPDNDNIAQVVASIVKTQDYSSAIVNSFSSRITTIRGELHDTVDGTVVLRDSTILDDKRTRKNVLTEIYNTLCGTNGGNAETSRKVIIIISDNPCNYPDNFPAMYLNLEDDVELHDYRRFQNLSGAFDNFLIKNIMKNPDSLRKNISQSVLRARESLKDSDNVNSKIMILATAYYLCEIGIVTSDDVDSIITWLNTTATIQSSLNEAIIDEFKVAVNNVIHTGELKITRQFGPCYYTRNDSTAFVADKDKSLNFEADAFFNLIFPKIKISQNKNKIFDVLKEDVLICTHKNKRKLEVADDNCRYSVDVFSVKKTCLMQNPTG